MVHLIEFTVLAEPLDCSAPCRVPVLRCLCLGQHMGPWELPLGFAGAPVLVLRACCNPTAHSLPVSSAMQNA